MKKYIYYISMVLDGGLASEDLKANTLKEARKQIQTLKKQLTKSFIKECNSIELFIDRVLEKYNFENYLFNKYVETIYYKKIK